MNPAEDEVRERRSYDPWRAQVTERLDSFDDQIKAIKANTDDIVEFFEAGRGFFVVVRSVGAFAKWLAAIAAGLGIAYAVLKFGIGQVIADLKGK